MKSNESHKNKVLSLWGVKYHIYNSVEQYRIWLCSQSYYKDRKTKNNVEDTFFFRFHCLFEQMNMNMNKDSDNGEDGEDEYDNIIQKHRH